MTALKARHDPVTRLDLIRGRKAVLSFRDMQGELLPDDFDRVLASVWQGWTPAPTGMNYRDAPAGSRNAGDTVWVFTHPQHGWGVMFVAQAGDRWRANRMDALKFAMDLSVSGPSLTHVCRTYLSMGAGVDQWSAQAVARLVSLPGMQKTCTSQQVEFMLALLGHLPGVATTSAACGYGPVFPAHRVAPSGASTVR